MSGRRELANQDLVPVCGLEVVEDGHWRATNVKAEFATAVSLNAGWYRFRVRLRSLDRFHIRKRADLKLIDTDGRSFAEDSVAWNREVDDGFLVHLPRAAERLIWTLTQAEGEFELGEFSFRRLSRVGVTLAAFREKVRLLRAFDCFGPALRRAVRMALRGQVRTVARKLVQGLLDGRAMRQGGYRANSTAGGWMRNLSVKADEADGAWWRRHAMPAEEAAHIRAECDAMRDTVPVAVLVLIDTARLDEGRLAALSVRRQLYPHWELLLACSGPRSCESVLASWLGNDPRVRTVVVEPSLGVPVAVARTVAQTSCERIVVLPAGVELTEDALYRFAIELNTKPTNRVTHASFETPWGASAPRSEDVLVGGLIAGGGKIWMRSLRRLPDAIPEMFAADRPETDHQVLDRVVAYPLEGRACVGFLPGVEERSRTSQSLYFGADLQGLSGWDHLAYAVLTGLPSLGVRLIQCPRCLIRPDLLPPRFVPGAGLRTPRDRQLVIGPPFLLERFELDENSAVFTMWETDLLRPAEVKLLNRAGLVIVPSAWGVECFRNSGVTVPMEMVPLGYDPLVLIPDDAFPEVCTFGTAGALTAGGVRKNAAHVIDLFRQAFPHQSDVRLRVKVTPTSPAIDAKDDPRIDVIRTTLPNTELAKWYRSLTAYVNASSGEGFGLHLIEAMACGRPLISTYYSGPTEFFDHEVGYVVGHRRVPARHELYTGHWAQPNDDDIVSQMRRIYADVNEARIFGERSATRASGFTWKQTGRRLSRVLRNHGFLESHCEIVEEAVV